jgi:hypothetical protein
VIDRPAEIKAVIERLEAERPIPSAGFRGALRASLLTGFRREPSPGGARRLIAAYAGSGTFLLAIVAIGIAGAGPLAA